MSRHLFKTRVSFKPFEYPEIIQFKDAINHSYWLVTEWNFTSDIQDFNVSLSSQEKNVIKNTLLAISQIEVAVKKFWAKIGDRFPKPEFDQVGITFGESEVRHADAYSHLLEILGLNEDFQQLDNNPAIKGRIEYLKKYLKSANDKDNQNFTLTLTLFSIFVENVSLFSQFVIIKSFNKYKNLLKDIDNVVQATQKEEIIHSLFGVELIKLIQKEHPDWFNPEFYNELTKACKKAYKSECEILDWIFEQGELDFIQKRTIQEFIKKRFNESLESIGGVAAFEVDEIEIKKLKWFDDEIHAEIKTDFFNKKPVTYSKKNKSITSEDLF